MANTSAVFARIDTELKEQAEAILVKLGISPTSAIQMLYSQVVLQNGMPFDLKLPAAQPTAIGGLSRAELDAQLHKGLASLQTGSPLSAAEVAAKLDEAFGL